MRTYSIILEPDEEDGGFSVLVPALPGCVTQGATVEECLENAQEAIAVWIKSAERFGEPVPIERQPPRILQVQVAA